MKRARWWYKMSYQECWWVWSRPRYLRSAIQVNQVFKRNREARHSLDIAKITGGQGVGVAQKPPHHLISISHEYYRNLPIAVPLLSQSYTIKTNWKQVHNWGMVIHNPDTNPRLALCRHNWLIRSRSSYSSPLTHLNSFIKQKFNHEYQQQILPMHICTQFISD